jgi:hypothetical protein
MEDAVNFTVKARGAYNNHCALKDKCVVGIVHCVGRRCLIVVPYLNHIYHIASEELLKGELTRLWTEVAVAVAGPRNFPNHGWSLWCDKQSQLNLSVFLHSFKVLCKKIPPRGPPPYSGEGGWTPQWPGELCWWERKLLVGPPIPDISKNRGQTKCSPWSSR